MVKRNFKYQSGEGNQYYTRKAAMRKLQLSMKDFRRLCILKGIYPREPKHRAIAQRGSTDIRVLYHKKDIRFLLHEPIVWTLRDRKIFNRRIASAKGKGDKRKKDMRMSNYPEIKLDHIIKERYPSFIDAIKDMDDCLTLLFLFSTFPALKTVTRDLTSLSRRLTIEWMHYCIAAKALRKVFVSIKGYYFQAEVKGQMVTWIVPHYYPFQPPKKQDIDLTIMRCFADFYSTLCGFVNFRLYNTINLVYPPQFTVSVDSEDSQKSEEVFVSERIAALNADLLKTDQDQANEEEEIDLELLQTDKDSEKVQQMREEAAKLKRLKTLFKGLKFFINREVPREPLVFIIRSFGGKVSWDKTLFVGATFDESDETITHQIADRPTITNKYISRDYIQPQWVFDSVNQCKLLPTNQYFVGEILPPHLSPFVSAKEEGQYAPPEELALTNPMILQRKVNKSNNEGISDDEEEEHEDEEMENNQGQLDYALAKAFMEERDEGNDDMKVSDSDNDTEDYQKDGNNEVTKKQKEGKKKKMVVKAGQIYKENPKEAKQLTKQEEALRAKMVKSRHRKLYRKLVDERKIKEKEANKLKMKRQQIDKQGLKQVKAQRKDERKKILKDN